MFQMAIVGWLNVIKDVLNRYAIPRLYVLNGWALDDELAQFQHDGVEIPDLDSIGTFLSNLKLAGMTMFPNELLERDLLEKAGLPVQGVKLGVEDPNLGIARDAAEAKANAPDPIAGPKPVAISGKPAKKSSSPEFEDDEDEDTE